MAKFIEQRWYSKSPGSLWFLAPFEWLTKLVVTHRFKERKIARVDDALVIVIGNLTVGGTGKTPVIAALAQHLQKAGHSVGVISRGYKGELSSSNVVKVAAHHAASEVGDEPKLLADRGLDVWISVDRLAAAKEAATRCNIILSDDGLQHYRLPRSIEICVVDGKRGLGNGHLLPVGPLREPASRLDSVHLILANAQSADGLPTQDVFTVAPTQWREVASGRVVSVPMSEVSAVCGIGNPQRFRDTMEELNIKVSELIAFPDHHQYTAEDFVNCKSAVVMTEKDAVKAKNIAPSGALYLCVDANLSKSFLEKLDKLIETSRL